MDNDQVSNGLETQVPIETPPVSSQSESAAPAESPKEAPAEKMFTQTELNAIAAKESRKATERAEAKVRAEYESRLARETQPEPQQSIGGVPQQSTEDIQRLIRQEAFRMSREHQAKMIEDDWVGSMNAEKDADPEFSNLYDAINIEAQPNIVLAMAGMQNKAHVVKDLAKNPSKYANILALANGGSFGLAQLELNKLSASIKANTDAKQQPKVDAPLSQIKSSNIGGDGGNLSVTDYAKQDWLRG
jgi:hypothetical protein